LPGFWALIEVPSINTCGGFELPRLQTTDNFIAAIENAFHYFGGVPMSLVIENLKAAVKQTDWFDQ
jgi:hypothetical protein